MTALYDKDKRRLLYLANRENCLAKMKEYRDNNKEKILSLRRSYYDNNKEKVLLHNREYAKLNPEKPKQAVRRHRDKNRELVNHRASEWRKSHPDLRREICSAWEKANPEKVIAKANRRRCAKISAEGRHSVTDMKNIRLLQRNRCAYCKCELGRKGHLDHIVPLSKGGSNWPSNLQWLCVSCNCRKGAKDPSEFAQSMGMLL